MSEEQIDVLMKYARQKIENLGQEIADGNIDMNPKVYKDRDACTFCQYKNVCSFDSRLKGHEKEELKDLEPEEIWGEIRAKIGENQEA